jgi:hypothetical protein
MKVCKRKRSKAAKTKNKLSVTEEGTTVEVSKEYLDALRKAVGRLIDPETAETTSRHVWLLDPYGDDPDLPPEAQCIGRVGFARAPGTDVWIADEDVPAATYKRLVERCRAEKPKVAATFFRL